MTKPKTTTGTPREYYEGRPSEDQFERARREAEELVKASDEIMARGRQADQRKAEYREWRPRFDALTRMGREAVGHRSVESAAARRRALHAHPVYASLPESERRAWDILLDEWTESILTGDLGAAWHGIEQLAGGQASGETLAGWDPPAAETESPADLAALIPRG